MPEAGGTNIETAIQLSEQKGRSFGAHQELGAHQVILEIIEAITLAVVAIATAWNGYQAARWTGRQGELYHQSSKARIRAEGFQTAANQELLYNAATVVEWLKAEANGDKKLAEIFVRRVLPEFRPAFEAWVKTDPLNNPNAPAGPLQEDYHSRRRDESIKLDRLSGELYEQGNLAREHADDYVRVTVTLATVLLLIAISQRFNIPRVRVGLLVFAMLLLFSTIYRISTLPRL
ncbi:MAG: hypothetical protein JO033_18610 [Acidobacteriaceae bacterium]|nr:hypothetical protein [Acidobacteriaceae bacterium]MBV9500573.1 hypothetical protein [Acidobacteriaceae bacterium]